eukprot:924534-Amphidinium_carterae.1
MGQGPSQGSCEWMVDRHNRGCSIKCKLDRQEHCLLQNNLSNRLAKSAAVGNNFLVVMHQAGTSVSIIIAISQLA